MAVKTKIKKKNRLSPSEIKLRRTKRDHAKLIKNSFRAMGFTPVPSAADKNFTYDNATSDFDDVFVYQNIITLLEYTVSQESDVSSHIKNKKILYDKIAANTVDFLNFFFKKFPDVEKATGGKYSIFQMRVVICYCSLNTVKSETKALVSNVKYLDYNVAKYFDVLSKTVKLSARFEMFDFFGLTGKDVGSGVLTSSDGTRKFPGSILPESHSNFGDGFKVVSFYIDPDALLERSYVLRKYGWRDGGSVYQRMIVKSKIASVRKYLKDQQKWLGLSEQFS